MENDLILKNDDEASDGRLPTTSCSMPSASGISSFRCMVNYSGGLSSWAAAKLWAERNGTEGLVLVFADVLMEDEDSYRFLIEGAALVYGLPFPDCAYWEIPEIGEDMQPRKDALKAMSAAAMTAIPGLVWITEGRCPWELMNDVRLLGNSQFDPCSDKLKRKFLAKWIRANLDSSCEIVLGINWDESERLDRVRKRNPKWNYTSPLISYNVFMGNAHKIQWLASLGCQPPRMYAMNFAHGNCGGFCIKSGHGGFKTLHKHFPDRYAYHESKELALIAKLGSDRSILKCRRGVKPGGKPKRLTLEDLRKRIEADELTEEEQLDLGGCTCALPI